MIRVHRSPPGTPLSRARDRAPVLEAADVSGLLHALTQPEHVPLSVGEVRAIRFAASTLDRLGSASILLAADGQVFRVEDAGPPTPARAPHAPALPAEAPTRARWATTAPGAAVVVAHANASYGRRLRDALRFMGYACEAVALGPDAGEGLRDLARLDPFALVACEEFLEAHADDVERARETWKPSGIVLLTEQPDRPLAPGVVACLALPVRFETVASLLDGIAARVRGERSELSRT